MYLGETTFSKLSSGVSSCRSSAITYRRFGVRAPSVAGARAPALAVTSVPRVRSGESSGSEFVGGSFPRSSDASDMSAYGRLDRSGVSAPSWTDMFFGLSAAAETTQEMHVPGPDGAEAGNGSTKDHQKQKSKSENLLLKGVAVCFSSSSSS